MSSRFVMTSGGITMQIKIKLVFFFFYKTNGVGDSNTHVLNEE